MIIQHQPERAPIGAGYKAPEAMPTLNTQLDAFLATITSPLARGKAKAALQEMTRFNGVVWNRFKYAEERLADFDRVDWVKKRIYYQDDVFLQIGSRLKTFAQYVEFLKLQAAQVQS